MKRASSKKTAHRAIATELAEFRSAGNAKELRVELSVLKGLAGLPPEQFGLLAEQLRVRSFRKRALVYGANPAGDMIHIMLSGISRLTAINRINERVLLEVLGPGNVICIPTLLPDVRHSLECEAFTECQVGVLSAQALVETVGLQYNQFLIALRLTMGRWWGLLVRQSRFVDQTLEERIAVALLDLAEKFGLPDGRSTIINVRFGHRDIAELVSGSRPKVTVCLKRFEVEGALIQEPRRIIMMPDKLSAFLSRSFENSADRLGAFS
jgi:CRP/FNR family transcriptional regulator, cyclic AMP receptor protein